MLDRTDPATDALIRAIAGQYRIEREVGRGGMGIVYLAIDEQLERPVAIKTLPPHLAADARVRDRFLREARTAGKLSHPNIVPIYAAAERDGVVYFAMRYINGESLAERIARSGPLPPADVVALLRQLASALAYAHANGVVHRDIKAENVLLDSETGRAMLTDFGIARLAETQPLTATGTVLGTVQYMSPEQVSGDTLDGRSDLYSLGVLAFLALSGRFPFERPTASAIVVAHVTSTPPNIRSLAPAVPAALGDLVDRLLAKSPGDRYTDGHALRLALDALDLEHDGSMLVSSHDSPPLAGGLQRARSDSARSMTPQPAPDATSNAPRHVMSSADADQVWARAAELQANTGLIVPPAQFQSQKPTVPSDTVGFDTDVVRASAVSAGIDARYVDRALEERARAAASPVRGTRDDAPVAIASVPSIQSRINPFFGTRTKTELETAFDGELSEIGFEEVADEIRRSLGEMVTVSAVGRTLTVTSAAASSGRHGAPRRLQIHLTSRNGRTNVRAFEDMRQVAAAMFGGIMGGVGGGGGSVLMGIIMGTTQNGGLATAGVAGAVAVGYLAARTLFKRTVKKRDEELREVLQRVVRRAQESMPPPSNTRR